MGLVVQVVDFCGVLRLNLGSLGLWNDLLFVLLQLSVFYIVVRTLYSQIE